MRRIAQTDMTIELTIQHMIDNRAIIMTHHSLIVMRQQYRAKLSESLISCISRYSN